MTIGIRSIQKPLGLKKDSFSGRDICAIMSRQAGSHGLKLEDLGTSLSLSPL